MKKLASILLVGVFVLCFGMVSAKTAISGVIYNADYSVTVDGAFVEVDCDGNLQNTTSMSDGTYNFVFSETDCGYGDSLTVFASHPSYGSNSRSGIIHNEVFDGWDLAVVNVPLLPVVPEFGVVVGLLTMLSAVGIFFVVRKD